MLTKQLDATIVAGDVSNLWANGILCYTEKAFKFVDSHPLAVGHWQHDTFWCGNRDADIVIEHLINAGFEVE